MASSQRIAVGLQHEACNAITLILSTIPGWLPIVAAGIVLDRVTRQA
jgi:hypothetical protein